MSVKAKIYNIEWDTCGEDVKGLPVVVNVEVPDRIIAMSKEPQEYFDCFEYGSFVSDFFDRQVEKLQERYGYDIKHYEHTKIS